MLGRRAPLTMPGLYNGIIPEPVAFRRKPFWGVENPETGVNKTPQTPNSAICLK